MIRSLDGRRRMRESQDVDYSLLEDFLRSVSLHLGSIHPRCRWHEVETISQQLRELVRTTEIETTLGETWS
jgi:hypothetical protein